jgi:hypothetical protein
MIHRKNLKTEILEGGIIKKTFDIYDDGGCQCYNDCDCYLRRGIIEKDVVMYNDCFTLEEAKVKLQQSKNNKEKREKDISEMLIWQLSMSKKQIFDIISKYKAFTKNLKNYGHTQILEDNGKCLLIYYWWKKNQ